MHDALRELPPPSGLGLPYPQLIIPYSTSVFCVRPLPADLSRELLITLARSAMEACEMRHRMCLVFHRHEGLYLETDGSFELAPYGPLGGVATLVAPPELDFLPGPDPVPAPAVPPRGPVRRPPAPYQMTVISEIVPEETPWRPHVGPRLIVLAIWVMLLIFTAK